MLLGTSVFADTSTWTGAVDGNWDLTTINWSNSGAGLYADGDAVIFNDTLGANFGITVLGAGVAPASILFADTGAGTNAYTFSGGGINGAGSLTLDSGFGGTVTLNAINGYTGGTVVNAGTLNLSAGGWAGAINGVLTINAGGTVKGIVDDALGWGDPGARVTVVNVNGGIFESTSVGNQGRSQTWNLTGGTLRSNNGEATGWANWDVGRIVFGPGTVVETFASATSSLMEGQFFLNPDDGHDNQTFTVADGEAVSDLLVTGNIATAYDTVGITKEGAGTMTLAANSSYNGGTTVNAGTLNLASGGWAGGIRGVLTINAGATVIATVNDALGYADASWGVTVTQVNVNGGIFESTSTGNQGRSQTWNLTGATLRSNNGVATEGFDWGAGSIVFGPGTVVETFASATSSLMEGQFLLNSDDGHDNQTFTVADGAAATDLLVTGNIATTFGTVGITKEGAGTMTLASNSSYNGGTTVNAGTLNLSAGGWAGTVRGVLTINAGATVKGTTDDALGWGAADFRVTVVNVNGGMFESTSGGNQGLSQTWNLTGGTVRTNNGVATNFLDYGAGRIVLDTTGVVQTFASADSSVFEGQIFLRAGDGHISQTFTVADGAAATDLLVSASIGNEWGTVGITKDGAGTMTVTGVNTYDGDTLVSAGTLVANNTGTTSATGTGMVTVSSGATLAGAGRIAPADGKSVLVNGILRSGNVGSIAAENLELVTSGAGTISLLGTLEFDIYDNVSGDNPAESNDQLLLFSDTSIVLGGTLKVTDTTTFSATDWAEGDMWLLLDWSNVTAPTKFTGGFTTLDLPTLDSGLTWTTTTDSSGFYIAVAVVPEPGRALLLFGALVWLILRRRRPSLLQENDRVDGPNNIVITCPLPL